jgi:1,2-dihydroxy-3-keto-5-methylthiopentene dioxygenase
MATVRIPSERRTITDQDEVTRYLRTLSIDYERWAGEQRVAADASPEDVLAAYAPEIEQLKARGGYVTADVIDVTPATPGLDAMLAKFNIEHWHDEDEVRFIIRGRGLFHIHPPQGPVIAIEVERRFVRVPRHAPLVRSLRRSQHPRDPAFRTDPAGRRTTRAAAPIRASAGAWGPRISPLATMSDGSPPAGYARA